MCLTEPRGITTSGTAGQLQKGGGKITVWPECGNLSFLFSIWPDRKTMRLPADKGQPDRQMEVQTNW